MRPDEDDEFGVPFPGVELPGDRWTRTGLKDDGLPFDWAARFGREAPRVLDLGCGNGRFLIASALARPTHDHLGIEAVQRSADWAAQRGNRRGLTNVRFVTADVHDWMFGRLAATSADEVHIYHPQPCYEKDPEAKRLLTPEFLTRVWEVLRPGGILVLQTDNQAYWRYLRKAVPFRFEVSLRPQPWPDAPEGRTRREIFARKKGLAVWRMVATRLETPLPGDPPRPDFDANRPRFQVKSRP